MDIAKELYGIIEDISERGQDLDKLREEIFEYIRENCRQEAQGKFLLTDSQKEVGTPFEVTRMAYALFLGYHVLVDELSKDIDELFEIIKEDTESGLYKTLAKFKKNIELSRKYFGEAKLKGH